MPIPEADDPVETLLAECLAAEDPAAAVATALAAHPEFAPELRKRWDFLVAAAAPVQGAARMRDRLGRFHLLEQLGGGGMGVVFRAIEEPPGREVALKLIRPEHLWFEGAHRRFLREMETVAALSHPGIVPVYSCGEHDGVPYCAMEYVRGSSLSAVLAALRQGRGVPEAQALQQTGARDWTDACFRVVLQIAEALAHVHDRGIVHRDVKPSNVMLDRSGRARLIDFGLARNTSHDSMTKSGVQPGSLAYMSPEQVRGDEVDGRTDVWSLGVVLHEMLTLEQPFVAATEEATRHRILAGAPKHTSSSTASRVPWDAATVVATALAPEPGRRYQSMTAFADDLRAIVDRRPITARRPSALLRTRRWVQRHPGAAAGAAVAAMLLVVLPIALLIEERVAREEIGREAQRAQVAEVAAKREATTSQRVVGFLQDLFYEVDPWRARGTTVPARVILDRGVQRIRSELQGEPEVRAELLGTMGRVYLNLGLFRDAETMLRDGLDLRQRVLGQRGAALRKLRSDLAATVESLGHEAEAEALLRQALDELPADQHVDRARLQIRLAHCAWQQDRVAEADRLYDETIAALSQHVPPGDYELLSARLGRGRFRLARIDAKQGLEELEAVRLGMTTLLPADHPVLLEVVRDCADAALQSGKAEAAEADLRLAIASAEKVYDRTHPSLAMLRERLATTLLHMGRSAEAMAPLEAALDAFVASYTPPHAVIAQARNLESTVAFECGDLQRSARAARVALRDYEQLFPKGSLDYAIVLGNLARVLVMLGNLTEAEELARRAVQMHETLGQRRPDMLGMARAYLGHAEVLNGKVAEATADAEIAVNLLRNCADVQDRAHVGCYAAEVLLLAGKKDAALALAREAERDWQAGKSTPGVLWARFVQGWALNQQEKHTEAVALLRATLEEQRRTFPKGHPYIAYTAGELAVGLARLDDLAGAEALLLESLASRAAACGPDNALLILPVLNLGTLELRQGKADAAVQHGDQLLEILRRNEIHGGRFVDWTVRLLSTALPKLPDAGARARHFAELRAAATQLGASADEIGRIDAAEGAR